MNHAVQELDGFPQLRPPDDRVVHEEQVLVLDQRVHRDLLHLGNLIPVRLVGRHEAAENTQHKLLHFPLPAE